MRITCQRLYKLFFRNTNLKQFESKLSNFTFRELKERVVTLTLTLREVHLVKTSRELALLDLLREVGVPEFLGELDTAIVAARLRRP